MISARGHVYQRLVWTLAGLALAIIPHASHLPTWTLVFALSLGAWRFVAGRKQWRMPPPVLRVAIAFLGFGGVFMTYWTINGLDAGSALLIIMMTAKLTETRSPRDETVLLMACYFLVLTSFLYTQSIWNLLYLGLSVWVITAAMWVVGRSEGPVAPADGLRTSARMLLQSLPLMVLLFVLFPRVPGPFWALPTGGGGVTGLDDKMSPGEISELTLSDDVAFRVRFAGIPPSPEQRYWRGPVLHHFNGSTWRGEDPRPIRRWPTTSGEGINYRVTLEPHRRMWLYALDVPGSWGREKVNMAWDYQLINHMPVHQLISYDVTSFPDYQTRDRHPEMMAMDSALSGAHNPRTRLLARTLRSQSSSDREFIGRILEMFREEEFFYTLQPGRLGDNSVDDFLFNTRKGFCGHFASAFTTLMRAADIPARVVTGYQGGEYNRIGDYFIVRQSDAHAWSEVWLGEGGWVRVDPTAAVAPERIQQGLAQALPSGSLIPSHLLRSSALLNRLRMTWDMANNLWNEWVINFDGQTQRKFMSWLGFERAHWQMLIAILVVAGIAFMGWLAFHLSWEFRARPKDPAGSAYQRFCRKLARIKLVRRAGEAPSTFAQRVSQGRPELSTEVSNITGLYLKVRYGPDATAEDQQRLRELVSAFQP